MAIIAPSLDPNPYSNGQRVTVDGNIQTALSETAGMDAAGKLSWFFDKVAPGGDWDYKNRNRYTDYDNSPESQDFGNFNYGAVGNVLGIPQAVLDAAAGWAQVLTDEYNKLFNHQPPKGSLKPFDKNYGDAPGDQEKINEGVKWAKENGHNSNSPMAWQVLKDFLKYHFLLPSKYFFEFSAELAKYIADNFSFASIARKSDPLTFDLDGDGIETVGVSTTAPILFDLDADGVKTSTGWIKSDDALLVRDINGNGVIDNGRELFGDATILTSGTRAGQLATDGFDALADLDSNHDGKISSLDTAFSSLRLWRDLNQDGISQSNELFTLSTLGIASINVSSTDHLSTLTNGNQLADLGSFTKTDGTQGTVGEVTGNLADINLAQDTFTSQFTDHITLTTQAQTLPDMQGSGQVCDLRKATSMDNVKNKSEWRMAA